MSFHHSKRKSIKWILTFKSVINKKNEIYSLNFIPFHSIPPRSFLPNITLKLQYIYEGKKMNEDSPNILAI